MADRDDCTFYTADDGTLALAIVDKFRQIAVHWATLPHVDPETEEPITDHDRCMGVAFSILVALDGQSGLPAFDLYSIPNAEDGETADEIGRASCRER